MKYAHSLKLSVFSNENEDSGLILSSLKEFFPLAFADKIKIKKTEAEGVNENKIEIFEIILTKDKLINQFLESLTEKLDKESKKQIIKQSESRLDENLDFFIRFDKDSRINEKELVLTDSGKCFHLKMAIAAFPKKREVALNIVKELFK